MNSLKIFSMQSKIIIQKNLINQKIMNSGKIKPSKKYLLILIRSKIDQKSQFYLKSLFNQQFQAFIFENFGESFLNNFQGLKVF